MKKKGSFVAEEVRGERGGGVEVRAQSAEGRRPKRGCAIENGRRCLPRQMARTRDATEAIIGPKGQHVSAQTGIFTAQLAHICWVNPGLQGCSGSWSMRSTRPAIPRYEGESGNLQPTRSFKLQENDVRRGRIVLLD